jgi:hypothetical protein
MHVNLLGLEESMAYNRTHGVGRRHRISSKLQAKRRAQVKEAEFEELWSKAHQAGMDAGQNAGVMPMIVGTAASLFGTEIDHSKKTYFVEGGVCGFAWINVKPAHSGFAKWLVVNDHARKDSYYGGITIWVGEFGQSMQRKEAYAGAAMKVLQEAGIKCRFGSRMD